MRETQVRSLGREEPLEEAAAPHSSTLGWKIPRTEQPGGLQSTEDAKSQTGLKGRSMHAQASGCGVGGLLSVVAHWA